MPDDEPTRRSDAAGPAPGPVAALQYATVEKAELYRAIMRLFAEAKSRFVLHMRPAEAAAALLQSTGRRIELDELERALIQLREWGNLEQHYDTSLAATVEEFNRPHFLYQITRNGEAAERALQVFEETVEQPGELQSAALTDIRDQLGELALLAETPAPDAAKVLRAFEALAHRFEQMTGRAQTFIANIQPAAQIQSGTAEAFVAYKQMLIDYLERFIHELVVRSTEIAALLERIEAAGVARLTELAASRELVDTMAATDAMHAAAARRWAERWRGLRGWFIADGDLRPQAEELRAHARAAIPALLRAVAGIHDRRLQRSDRVADLKTLARWFATCPDDGATARLWRAGFALAPARHLRVTEETLDAWDQQRTRPGASWLEAPPLRIAPRLRRTGTHARRGRPASIISRTKEKAALAALAQREARQIETARRRLQTPGPILLSQMARLDQHAFDLFLELLGEALARKHADDQSVEASSIDGATRIRLTAAPQRGEATIETAWGWFQGCEHIIEIDTPGLDDPSTDGEGGPASAPPVEEPLAQQPPADHAGTNDASGSAVGAAPGAEGRR